jgi:hypothetical protein
LRCRDPKRLVLDVVDDEPASDAIREMDTKIAMTLN